MDMALVLSGFAVGMLVGTTGVGGGAVMTPLLITVFYVPPLVAVGTDIVFAAVTKTVGAWTHSRQGTIHWPIVGWLALGSLPAAVASLTLVSQLALQGSDGFISVLLGAVLVVSAAAMFWSGRSGAAREGRVVTARPGPTVLLGALLGVLVTLTSVGAGALGAAVLRWLYPRMPIAALVGTDIAHALVLAIVGGLGHWQLGSVDLALLGALLTGSVPGIYLGSRLGAGLPDKVTRPLMASLLAAVGIKLII